MPTKRKRILVSFTPEEKADVEMKADQIYTSISEFLRGLILGHGMPKPEAFEYCHAIRDLLTVNADQARLGNLLKLALDVGGKDLAPMIVSQIEDLITDIRKTQDTLRDGVETLHYKLHPRRAKRGRPR
ncbi:plasmid mobilization protein [Shumkonia mesophila]|uniref:plasmid mobilization protein n=1 Tax=Shumkonia mesophila TaxID=2838854 RepID=UPI0029348745|nr:hypothetical protein [Shumkonia mesophila]